MPSDTPLKSEGVALGVDIGGTKVAAGLVATDGHILYQTRVAMVSREDAAAGFRCVAEAIRAVFAARPEARSVPIGICAPGPLDPRTGVVLNPPNVPCWRNFPLAGEMRKAFDLPARLDNDANAAALAEALWGAGVGYENIFYATLGTGIGTGIVFHQRIYHGRTGSAAEGGHLSIDYRGPKCGCGKRGCVEVLCSGPAIVRRARERLAETDRASSTLLDLCAGNPERLTAENVEEAFHMGDELAAEVLNTTSDLLAVWLGNVIDLLEPDVIVIGGGLSQLMSTFFTRILGRLPTWSINPRCAEIPLLRARYGAEAGIAGAAALCR